MITIIFLDDNNEPVSISFRKNYDLYPDTVGTWNINNNQVELNSESWEYFKANRNNIRRLRPLLEKLERITV